MPPPTTGKKRKIDECVDEIYDGDDQNIGNTHEAEISNNKNSTPNSKDTEVQLFAARLLFIQKFWMRVWRIIYVSLSKNENDIEFLINMALITFDKH